MFTPAIYRENLFDNFFNGFPFFNDREFKNIEKQLYGHNADRIMSTDVKEQDNGFVLEMDLPGFSKDEITASLDNGYLNIQAAKGLDKTEEDKDTGRYIRKERYAGSYSRSFYVGDLITEEDIKAEFKDGILKLFVPKKEAVPEVEQKKYIAIEG